MTITKEQLQQAIDLILAKRSRPTNGECPSCGELFPFETLTDEISHKEYLISGMCQQCQNEVFK